MKFLDNKHVTRGIQVVFSVCYKLFWILNLRVNSLTFTENVPDFFIIFSETKGFVIFYSNKLFMESQRLISYFKLFEYFYSLKICFLKKNPQPQTFHISSSHCLESNLKWNSSKNEENAHSYIMYYVTCITRLVLF